MWRRRCRIGRHWSSSVKLLAAWTLDGILSPLYMSWWMRWEWHEGPVLVFDNNLDYVGNEILSFMGRTSKLLRGLPNTYLPEFPESSYMLLSALELALLKLELGPVGRVYKLNVTRVWKRIWLSGLKVNVQSHFVPVVVSLTVRLTRRVIAVTHIVVDVLNKCCRRQVVVPAWYSFDWSIVYNVV